MLITGTEGCLPIQKNTTPRPAALSGGRKMQARGSRYDNVAVSAPQDGSSFRELAASLSYQVRTHNTTGKIQELRRAVSSGEYDASARETAARMLLMEEGE